MSLKDIERSTSIARHSHTSNCRHGNLVANSGGSHSSYIETIQRKMDGLFIEREGIAIALVVPLPSAYSQHQLEDFALEMLQAFLREPQNLVVGTGMIRVRAERSPFGHVASLVSQIAVLAIW